MCTKHRVYLVHSVYLFKTVAHRMLQLETVELEQQQQKKWEKKTKRIDWETHPHPFVHRIMELSLMNYGEKLILKIHSFFVCLVQMSLFGRLSDSITIRTMFLEHILIVLIVLIVYYYTTI